MGKEILRTRFGENILIELKSNPTTGYKWCVLSSDGLIIDEQYLPNHAKKGMCGVGGIEQLKITSASPGTFELKIAYKRQWEEDEGDVREYTLTFE